MDVLIQYQYLLTRWRRNSSKRLKSRRKQALKRRSAFARGQAQERAIFFVLLNNFIQSSLRQPKLVWMKERSGHWWEHVVKTTFTPQDWLDNFSCFVCHLPIYLQ